LAVHGLGDRPEAFSRLFQDFPVAAHVYVLRAPRPYHNGFDWFGVQVSGPPDALAQAVRHAADGVAAIAVVLARDPRNAGLPVVTGFSQGGYVSFAMAALHPELIRAALPVAGSLPRPLWPTRASDNLPPIIAFHGVADPVVALAPTRELCDALRGQRFNATLTEYPDVGHQIAPAIFRDWQDALSAQLADTKPKASGT
jgi:phospholipase/carboxylesterase